MIQYAKGLRGPAMVVVLVVLSVYVGLSVGRFVILTTGGSAVAAAAQEAGSSSPSLVWVFLAVALALACLFIEPRPRRSRRLVMAAAIVMMVVAVDALAFLVLGLLGQLTVGEALGVVGGVVETLVKAACAAVLWRLCPDSADEAGVPEDEGNGARRRGPDPVWRAEEAVGLQWARAGDAATGAPASSSVPPPALPEAVPPPAPVRRQLWSRGGMGPDALADAEPPVESSGPPARGMPWTTASEAADGYLSPTSGEDAGDGGGPSSPRREPPKWTPITRAE